MVGKCLEYKRYVPKVWGYPSVVADRGACTSEASGRDASNTPDRNSVPEEVRSQTQTIP
jgi:hypothetical protein